MCLAPLEVPFSASTHGYASRLMKGLKSDKKPLDRVCIDGYIYAYGGVAMRTTLDLPEDLLNEAMKATHIQTKTKVIITALEELIRKSRREELRRLAGRIDLKVNLSRSRKRQRR